MAFVQVSHPNKYLNIFYINWTNYCCPIWKSRSYPNLYCYLGTPLGTMLLVIELLFPLFRELV